MCTRGKTLENAIVIGEKDRGLYKLKGQPEKALIHESNEASEQWHKRIALVHYRSLPMTSKAVLGLPEI